MSEVDKYYGKSGKISPLVGARDGVADCHSYTGCLFPSTGLTTVAHNVTLLGTYNNYIRVTFKCIIDILVIVNICMYNGIVYIIHTIILYR